MSWGFNVSALGGCRGLYGLGLRVSFCILGVCHFVWCRGSKSWALVSVLQSQQHWFERRGNKLEEVTKA